MKKNYEKNQLIITMTFLFIVIFIILLINLFKHRYRTYKNINSIVVTENYLELIINSNDLKLLNSSNYLYIDNKKKKREIISIEKDVLKRNNITYHDVIIRVKFPNKYKDNDYVKLTIYNKKEKLFSIFKSCWKEE